MRRLALVLIAACTSSPPETGGASWSLSVGTHEGLEPMGPLVSGTMTAGLVELVYQPLSLYFESGEVTGDRVRLRLRPRRGLDIAELASSLVHPELLSAGAEGQDVVARFRSEEVARAIDMKDTLLATGKYEVAENRQDVLSLVRKAAGEGPPRIDVIAVATAEEEWRHLNAGQVDLSPAVPPGSINYLRQIPDLRVVPIESQDTAGLWFHGGKEPTSSAEVRQAIAGAVRRHPLAISVQGSPGAARVVDEDLELARERLAEAGYSASHPLHLRLVVHEGQTDLVRAALVLQQQLAAIDAWLQVDALPIEPFVQSVIQKDFDLLLFFGDTTPRYWAFLRGPAEGRLTHYTSQELDDAMAAGDETGAQAILERDVPVTPLFDLNEVVVIRRRFCNVHPHSLSSYQWLAEVRLCAPGEEN